MIHKRRGKYSGAVIAFMLILAVLVGFGAERPATSISRAGNFVVYAEDPMVADLVATEVERVRQRLIRCLGPTAARKGSALVVNLVGDGGEDLTDEGVVRIFQQDMSWKVQVAWSAPPVPLESFQQSVVHALCVRLALEFFPRPSAFIAKGATAAGFKDWRVPIWVAVGISGLVAEPLAAQENQERATLLAKWEPDLPLTDALRALSGRAQFDPSQRALASMICRVLTREAPVRDRFFSSLAWGPDVTDRGWLTELLPKRDLDKWWREAWKNEGLRLPGMRLGYAFTLHWARGIEDGLAVSGSSPRAAPRPESTGKDLLGVAHPWFQIWSARRPLESVSPGSLRGVALSSRAINLRRSASLEWFALLDRPETHFSRGEWLEWAGMNRRAPGKPADDGPVERWYSALDLRSEQ